MNYALNMTLIFKKYGKVIFNLVYPDKKAAKHAKDIYKEEIQKGLKKTPSFFIHSIDAPNKIQSDWDTLLIVSKNLISVNFQIIKMEDSKIDEDPEYYQVIQDNDPWLKPVSQYENPYSDAIHEDLED